MGLIPFHNATGLDNERLRRMCFAPLAAWRLGGMTVQVRYSRSADFSGSCCYRTGRIRVNLGRHVAYPYKLATHLARARSNGRRWWKPIYTVELADAYQLVLFVFLHECFHFLVRRARRNTRQKESMCDRFAVRELVDRYGAVVRDSRGRLVTRPEWDFQDLEGFVTAARRRSARGRDAEAVVPRPAQAATAAPNPPRRKQPEPVPQPLFLRVRQLLFQW